MKDEPKIKVSVSITPKQLQWLNNEVAHGRFASLAHGVREAIRKLMEEES